MCRILFFRINYYPFGLKHKGYNNVITGRDHKYDYNGVEREESLGYNMHEMALRHYDPAIARWVGIDPITHHNFTPYQAFDNNPIFWADPSGADSETLDKWAEGVKAAWADIDSGRTSIHDGFGSRQEANDRNNSNNSISSILDELDLSPGDKPDGSSEGIMSMINGSKTLSQMYEDADSPRVITAPNDQGDPGLYIDALGGDNSVTFRAKALTSNERIVSTIIHELNHGKQFRHVNPVLGMTWVEFARKTFGPTNSKYDKGSLFLEIQSYYLQIQSGDTNPDTRTLLDRKLDSFNGYN